MTHPASSSNATRIPIADRPSAPFAANEVALSPRGVVIALVAFVVLAYAVPTVWERTEPLNVEPDDRIPYRLGSDYWQYSRYCREARAQGKIPVVGDSVVWGHYVTKDQTLSHYLSELAGQDRFANLGLDGAHPTAMAGLIEHYGRSIAGTSVILNFNPGWLSSPRQDLSSEKEFAFNHPRLVPQFSPRIPCYRATLSERLGVVIGRAVPLLGWADHLRFGYLRSSDPQGDDLEVKDLPAWTVDHPYANPLDSARFPSVDEPPSPPPVAKPWNEQEPKIVPSNLSWVELETSLQWRSFRQAVDVLRGRGNRVFVLVGPFNEHILLPDGLRKYRTLQRGVAAWLEAEHVAYYVPPALPSALYADASHPLAEGYRLLAEQLLRQRAFAEFSAPATRANR